MRLHISLRDCIRPSVSLSVGLSVHWLGGPGLRPRTKVFVHFPIEITRLFDKIIGKIIRAYESTLKELSYATKLVTVAQFV